LKLSAYDRVVVPGHNAKVVFVVYWGIWNFNCDCGKNGGGYQSQEYALAAKRRHLRRASSPTPPASEKSGEVAG
jgi:hypothetical protein